MNEEEAADDSNTVEVEAWEEDLAYSDTDGDGLICESEGYNTLVRLCEQYELNSEEEDCGCCAQFGDKYDFNEIITNYSMD